MSPSHVVVEAMAVVVVVVVVAAEKRGKSGGSLNKDCFMIIRD